MFSDGSDIRSAISLTKGLFTSSSPHTLSAYEHIRLITPKISHGFQIHTNKFDLNYGRI